jgi:hypothetical protein
MSNFGAGEYAMTGVRASRRLGIAGLAALALAAAGCSQDDGRHPVTGTVSIGNEPIRGGFVTFEPASPANGNGRQGRAAIRDGRFDTRDGGEAAVPGPVVVRIQGWGAPTARFPNGVPVCHNYEIKMELQAGLNQLELKVTESARVKEPRGGWGEGP